MPYRPDQHLIIGDSLAAYPPEIEAAQQIIDGQTAELALPTFKVGENRGLTYAHIGDTPLRGNDVAVLFQPFANDVGPHGIVRAQFIHAALDAKGVRTELGDPLPVVMFASPSRQSGPDFVMDASRRQIAAGDLSMVSDMYLRLVSRLKVGGRVALLGFSQGASVAVNAASVADKYDLDVMTVAVGDPANVVERTPLQLLRDFVSQSDWKTDVKRGGVKAYEEATKRANPIAYLQDIIARRATNLALLKGLGHDRFGDDLEAALESTNATIHVGYGTRSAVTPRDAIERTLHSGAHNPNRSRVVGRAVVGARHTWWDNLPAIATHYLGAFRDLER